MYPTLLMMLHVPISALSPVLMVTSAHSRISHAAIGNECAGLLGTDPVHNSPNLLALVGGAGDGGTAESHPRDRLRRDLDATACLILHGPNDAPTLSDAETNVVIRNIDLDRVTSVPMSSSSSSSSSLLPLGLLLEQVFDKLLGEFCPCLVGVGDVDGPDVGIVGVRLRGDLHVRPGPVLNVLDGRTAPPDNKPHIPVGDGYLEVDLSLGNGLLQP